MDRSPKLIITRDKVLYNFAQKSEVEFSDILVIYLHKFRDYKNDGDELLVFKKNTADYEKWFVADLQLDSEFIGYLIERRKHQ